MYFYVMTIHNEKDHLLQGKRLKSFCNTSNIDKGVTRNSEGMISGVKAKIVRKIFRRHEREEEEV
eukprot:scaffold14003_cov156-Skeletonema_marinoi.AAC.2